MSTTNTQLHAGWARLPRHKTWHYFRPSISPMPLWAGISLCKLWFTVDVIATQAEPGTAYECRKCREHAAFWETVK